MILKRDVEIRSAKSRLNWLNKWAMATLEVANGKISVLLFTSCIPLGRAVTRLSLEQEA